MAHNVPWTVEVENEFRNRVRFSELEELVFDLHIQNRYTQAEIGEILGIKTRRVGHILHGVKLKYINAMLESDTLPPFFNNKMEILEWQKRQIACEHEMSTSEMSHLIDEWIFDEKSRNILKRRLLDNIKYEQLAEEFDMSVRQIKTIVCYSQEKLFKHIDGKY